MGIEKPSSETETKPIWHRIAGTDGRHGESSKAYEAANAYFTMGPERSLAKLCQIQAEDGPKPSAKKRSLATVKAWSVKWHWIIRAEAFDAHQYEEQELARKKARAALAERWIERDEQLREDFYQAGMKIVEKARRMIEDFPERKFEKTTSKDGQAVTIVVKPGASLSGLSQLMSVGCEMQRLAVGINPGSSPLDNLDFSQFSSEDLASLRDGRPIKPLDKRDPFSADSRS